MSGLFSGLMTLFLIILFLGIVAWAYSKRNKQTFDQMAQLPLQDEFTDSIATSITTKETAHE